MSHVGGCLTMGANTDEYSAKRTTSNSFAVRFYTTSSICGVNVIDIHRCFQNDKTIRETTAAGI